LTGSIPTQIGGLTSLERLDLSHNGLVDNLPVEMVGKMLNLEEVNLSYNFLNGPVLPKFWHLQRLRVLLLNDNSFTGALSPNLGDLAFLERLEVQNNLLTGVLPTQLGNLGSLQSLRTFGNSMNTTAVPDEICDLRRDPPYHGLQILEMDCVSLCRCCTPCQESIDAGTGTF
jgi:Leucine-rich repeat (LRR) protein